LDEVDGQGIDSRPGRFGFFFEPVQELIPFQY
jgi:hypothetical protein